MRVQPTHIAKTDLEAAKVALKQAQLNLEYAQVKAPVAGVMGREFVSEGTFVSGPGFIVYTNDTI